jgi:hypothetical protein
LIPNHTDHLEVHADLAWQYNAIDVRLAFRQSLTGHLYVAQPLVFSAYSEGALAPPAMRLTKTDAQVLMDELYRCGVRPTEGAGSAGSYAAQTRHLEDMRAVAFGLLGDEVAKP